MGINAGMEKYPVLSIACPFSGVLMDKVRLIPDYSSILDDYDDK